MIEGTSAATTAVVVVVELLVGLAVFVIALVGGYAVIRRRYVVPKVANRLGVPEANVVAAMDELGLRGPRLFSSRSRRDPAGGSDATPGPADETES